jgi:murein L,D-transpeptidase YafK
LKLDSTATGQDSGLAKTSIALIDMIHDIENGLGWISSLHRAMDWTDGCVAVTDPEIEEIWAAVPDGTPVEIRR